jgi:hypothetical protein
MVLMTIVSSSRTCSASPGFLLFGMGVGKGQRGARRHIMRVRSFCVPDKIEKLGKDSGVGRLEVIYTLWPVRADLGETCVFPGHGLRPDERESHMVLRDWAFGRLCQLVRSHNSENAGFSALGHGHGCLIFFGILQFSSGERKLCWKTRGSYVAH